MKEFGIRKVLGATIRQIAGLHTGYFLRIAILANFITLPFSYWLMKEWLTRFAYKAELNGLMFFEVAGIVFCWSLFPQDILPGKLEHESGGCDQNSVLVRARG